MSRSSSPVRSHVSEPSKQLRADAYTCPELGRPCARPGAYDAFDLPSLYGRCLHFPDGRVVAADAPTEPARSAA